MKTSKKLFLIFSIAFFAILTSYAQDIIITKDNQQIKAKILEIGTTEVRFKYFDAEDGPTIVLKKDEIRSMTIKGKNSQNTMNVNDDPMSASNKAILDKTSSLKFHFFSPMNNHLAFSYEWMFKPGFNLEAGLGIIGIGINAFSFEMNEKAGGAFIKAGAKFLLGSSSDFAIEGIKYAHPLKGRYIKVELSLGAFNSSYDEDTARYTYTYTSTGGYVPHVPKYTRVTNSYQCMALNLIYGRQFILGNSITAGWYAGIGYGFENRTTNKVILSGNGYYYYDAGASGNRYSHSYGGKDLPFTFTSGLNIGIILKAPKKLVRSTDEQNRYFIEKKGVRQNTRRIQ